ncbi:MAG: ABC transporter permease [Actinobacteria bacterium]|nr:ABC transporter permease [Thermoleophilia bacterium]MCB9011176.1 ABC transporter permease [Actinomycetota bacterium]
MPLRRNGLKIGDIEDRPDGGMGSTMVRGSGEGPHTIDWRRSLAARNARTRGRRHHPVFRIRDELSPRWRMSLTLVGLVVPLLIWLFMATSGSATVLVPSPGAALESIGRMWNDGTLTGDVWASFRRILIGYAISMAIAVVLGVLMGSFRSAESFLEAPIAFMRYVPATALVPLMLFWLGIDETPKIALIVIGSVFFNVLMVADVVRNVPKELISAAYTLGAGRLRVLRQVILPHSTPGIIDVARINLAAAWAILVVAELLAAEEGLAFRIVRAQRFRQIDDMFAILIIFGIIGVATDLSLRWFRNRAAPWARP